MQYKDNNFMPPTNTYDSRLYGLDTLRAVAISAVLMDNYRWVANKNIFGFMSQLGGAGVDLFFVLSGFLIGNQILSAFAKEQDFSLVYFYIRRLLRTLPNYYVVLALYFLFPTILNGTSTAPLISFLTFTQNVNMPSGSTFSQSWSLCVEEQFYLLFPVIAMLIAYSKKSVTLGWCVIPSAILLAMFVRAYTWYKYGQGSMSGELFMEHIYFSSVTRFDGLLSGVALAMLKNFHSAIFSRIQKHGNLLLIVGLGCSVATLYVFYNYMYVPDKGFSLLVTSFGYSLLALSFGVLVASALSTTSFLNRIRVPGATSLAIWSYAIYLIHEPVFEFSKLFLVKFGVDRNSNLTTLIIMTTSILCGWILYRTVETPFMALRSRYYPFNYKPATKK
jgi:peptidoglycan/LPS O-acetylase OafA/YrhL